MATAHQNSLEARSTTRAADKVSCTPTVELVLLENQQILEKVSNLVIAQLIEEIAAASRVFIVGEYRRSLALRLVAMRISDLGCQVYLLGEVSTLTMRAGDLVIACSNSDRIDNVFTLSEKARKLGARLVSVTAQVNSALGQISDVAIELAIAKPDISQGRSQQVASFLFEQSILLLFNTLFQLLTQNLHSSAEILALRLREKISLED